jgi:hypothetical protein
VLEPRNMRNAATSAVFTVVFGAFGVVFLAVALAHGS